MVWVWPSRISRAAPGQGHHSGYPTVHGLQGVFLIHQAARVLAQAVRQPWVFDQLQDAGAQCARIAGRYIIARLAVDEVVRAAGDLSRDDRLAIAIASAITAYPQA